MKEYKEFTKQLRTEIKSFLSTPKELWNEIATKNVNGLAADELRRLIPLETRRDNGAFFRIHTMNGFKTIVETNSEIVYKDKTSEEWFDLIYKTSMKHFFREEYKLFKSGYVKEKSGGCFGVLLVMGFAIFILTATLLK